MNLNIQPHFITDLTAIKSKGVTPNTRIKTLRRLISAKPTIRCLEAHNGITGLIVEKTIVKNEKTGINNEFDCVWVSSLTDSTAKGKPDTELVDFTSHIIRLKKFRSYYKTNDCRWRYRWAH